MLAWPNERAVDGHHETAGNMLCQLTEPPLDLPAGEWVKLHALMSISVQLDRVVKALEASANGFAVSSSRMKEE